jgi:high-affinity Fe2+/Pb2+ permease
MTTSNELSPQERIARERFIMRWGVQYIGLPSAVVSALLFFWLEHQSSFRWSALVSRDFAIILALWLVIMGWFGGRRVGADLYDWMRSRERHRPSSSSRD